MMKKRILAMGLGICLTVGMLGGCGRADKGDAQYRGENLQGGDENGAAADDGESGAAADDRESGVAAADGESGADAGSVENGTAPAKAEDGLNGDDAEDGSMTQAAPAEEPEQGMEYPAETESEEMNMYDGLYAEDCAPEPGYEGGMPPYGEEYTAITENSFVSAAQQPFSTFSADVDTASYSNLRRMILDGYSKRWISADSIRVEELINYFNYDYEGPRAGEPFGVNPEIAPCPWNHDNYLLRIGLQTEAIDFSDAAPSNLVFLIDVSGSMYAADKLPLLQQSFAMLASNLTSKDRVSIVTYAGSDTVVLTGARGNDAQTIIDALNSLEASGSTNGSAGIETAYEIAQEYFIEGGNNRVILATDGDLNVGLTTVEELEELVTEKKRTGIFLSVLGFGTGNIKDNRMETLADKGNGNYAYIDSLNEARKVLIEEMGATLVTVAKDVKLQMEFDADAVAEYRLIGYENRALAREDFTDDTKDAGEIGAGHSVTVLYEVRLTRGMVDGIGTLHIRCKAPEGERSMQFDYEIGRDAFSERSSDDFRFAASVAAFGMVLRGSEYCGELTLEDIPTLLDGSGIDRTDDEYRLEFVQLVRTLIENSAWEEEDIEEDGIW